MYVLEILAMNTKNLNNTFKIFASLIGIAGVSTLLSLPSKAQTNPNPSIFSERPYNRTNVAQTSPNADQQQNTPYTTPDINQPVQDTTIPATPGINQPVQDTTTPGITTPGTTTPGVTPGIQDNDDNGVRALW
ncbi:hypothetical protein CAL7716_097810 [Calothrix sp. PCC 7716]|nr:hypothetical protein CAL7716_097810 [Calothrix sp. PCC 7716]